MLSDLRSQKRTIENRLTLLTDKALDLARENLANIKAQIVTVETNLANCLEASVMEVSMETIGHVGTVKVETEGTVRLWFGLTESKDKADWIKIGRFAPGSP